MAVRVRLSDGINLIVHAELEEFTKSYREALRTNELLEVENGNGKMRVLNPQQILYFEDAGDEEASEEDPRVTAQAPPSEDLQGV